MRVTSSMYYENLYGSNNSKLNKKLFDVNKQIASGLKIQYASDNVSIFANTMQLDNEITALTQIKKSTQSAYKVSDQSDSVLNEFTASMNRMRTLLLQAANGTNDNTSLNAVAAELRGIEKNFKSLANTSINGEYLFSGSAVTTRPIADDGTYKGNDVARNAFVGSNNQQKYNITGSELFLGEENVVNREISSNVQQKPNLSDTLSVNTTIEELMGAVPAGRKHNFYLRGTQHDGTAINQKIQLDGNVKVQDLLNSIGTAYGNTGAVDVVTVSMSDNGNITVKDKLNGSSKLDFHLVGASDFGGTDESNVNNIDDLQTNGGVTDYNTALNTAPNLYIREFNKSGYTSATGAPSIEGLVYDRTNFNVSGNSLTSNVPQIVKGTNAFATPSTKLSEVASGTTLDAKQLVLHGSDVFGNAIGGANGLQINLNSTANGGSNFSLDGGATKYTIFDMSSPRKAVNADEMTYQQLMDVVNMSVTNNLPTATNDANAYDNAIGEADLNGNTFLSADGKISFNDLQFITTKANISLYDSNSGDFTSGNASALTFNANNSLTVRDPKTDFFKTVNEMITAVENHKLYPTTDSGDVRNVGIENAVAMMDDLQNHVFKTQSVAGAQSNTLDTAIQRTGLLEVSTKSLRSSFVDTDLAESSLQLTQLTLNYKAMLSTVGKVSQLSLVNYL